MCVYTPVHTRVRTYICSDLLFIPCTELLRRAGLIWSLSSFFFVPSLELTFFLDNVSIFSSILCGISNIQMLNFYIFSHFVFWGDSSTSSSFLRVLIFIIHPVVKLFSFRSTVFWSFSLLYWFSSHYFILHILLFICFGSAAYGILVLWSGIKPMPPALEVQSLSLWITREAPHLTHFRMRE